MSSYDAPSGGQGRTTVAGSFEQSRNLLKPGALPQPAWRKQKNDSTGTTMVYDIPSTMKLTVARKAAQKIANNYKRPVRLLLNGERTGPTSYPRTKR